MSNLRDGFGPGHTQAIMCHLHHNRCPYGWDLVARGWPMVGGPVETASLRTWGKDRSKDPQEEPSWPLRSWPMSLDRGSGPIRTSACSLMESSRGLLHSCQDVQSCSWRRHRHQCSSGRSALSKRSPWLQLPLPPPAAAPELGWHQALQRDRHRATRSGRRRARCRMQACVGASNGSSRGGELNPKPPTSITALHPSPHLAIPPKGW